MLRTLFGELVASAFGLVGLAVVVVLSLNGWLSTVSTAAGNRPLWRRIDLSVPLCFLGGAVLLGKGDSRVGAGLLALGVACLAVERAFEHGIIDWGRPAPPPLTPDDDQPPALPAPLPVTERTRPPVHASRTAP